MFNCGGRWLNGNLKRSSLMAIERFEMGQNPDGKLPGRWRWGVVTSRASVSDGGNCNFLAGPTDAPAGQK